MKKQLPDLGGANTVSEALAAAKASETSDSTLIAKLQAAAPVEREIKQLQDERKSLSEKGPRDKHYGQGAMLAFIGTIFAIEVRKLYVKKILLASVDLNSHLTSPFLTVGSFEHLCTCRKAISWPSPVRRSGSCVFVGIGSSMCPTDAKR